VALPGPASPCLAANKHRLTRYNNNRNNYFQAAHLFQGSQMTKIVCAPKCAPNNEQQVILGGPPTTGPTPGSSCENPIYSVDCTPKAEFDKSILCDPVTGASIIVVTTYSDTGVPTSTAYNIDSTPYGGAITALVSCPDQDVESDEVVMCDGGSTTFWRWVVKKNGVPTGVSFDTDLSGLPYVISGAVTPGTCAVAQMFVEKGCLSTPPQFDVAKIDRCAVGEVRIGGQKFYVSIPAGWTVNQFVDAVNAQSPGLLSSSGSLVTVNGSDTATLSIEIVCVHEDFAENFGTGARTSSPNVLGYTFAPSGLIADDFYAITNFADPGLAIWNNGNGNITADAFGNTAGRALIVNAAIPPSELYRQPATVVPGQEYRVVFYVADTTTLNIYPTGIHPNVNIEVRNASTNVLLGQKPTGNLPADNLWHRYDFDFVATEQNIQFVLRNINAGGQGNDYAIDRISFSRIDRQVVIAGPRGQTIPVEIVKRVSESGAIESIRVWNTSGSLEYTTPYPNSMILSVGECPIMVFEDLTIESDPIEWCLSSGEFPDVVFSTLTQWVVKKEGRPTGVVYWTDFSGQEVPPPAETSVTRGACGANLLVCNPVHWDSDGCIEGKAWYSSADGSLVKVTDMMGNTVPTPAGLSEGGCPIVVPQAFVMTDGTTIAGPVRAATPGFVGAAIQVDIPGDISSTGFPTAALQSFTVTAFATTPGLETLTANQIVVYTSTGRICLNPGETRTWSVERDQEQRLIASSPTVSATGNAYAHVSWSYAI
jgi:hypothetical protein